MAKKGPIQKKIDETVRRIVKRFDPERVILFGSYAKGTVDPDSDIEELMSLIPDQYRPELSIQDQRRLTAYATVERLVYRAFNSLALWKGEMHRHHMRRSVMGLLLTIILILSLLPPAMAAEFPSKYITLIIPMSAGGAMDITARALGSAAKKFLGQPVIGENIPGGGGTVGAALMVKKPADGYTLTYIASNNLNINWHMREMSFHPIEDVTSIIRITGMPSGIVVRADSQWKTIQEFIQYAKQNPQKISYATAGIGLPPHLAMEELAILGGGIQWVHIPYKGGGECNAALLGGHVEAVAGGSFWAPLVDAGKFRLLASIAPFRFPRYSQVPTLKEIGYDLAYSSPLDILGPRGIPKPIVAKLREAFRKAMDDQEFLTTLKTFDMVPIYLNPEELEKASQQEFEHMGKMVQKLGLGKK